MRLTPSARRGVARCGAAALLFGAATPAASRLGRRLEAFTLAGLLYLGAAVAMAPLVLRHRPPLDALRRGGGRLATAVLFGGVGGPVLLMEALRRSPASTVSLLLNLEVVFTVLLAGALFSEQLGARVLLGVVTVAGAGALLGWGGAAALRTGALFAVAACACWAVDNTVTANLDVFSPTQITMAKGVVAGLVNVALGAILGQGRLTVPIAAAALAVGAVGYGASIALWVAGARELGAARGQIVFAAAPFVGAALSWTLLGEALTARAVGAVALGVLGVALVLNGGHEHRHLHEPIQHDHEHDHADDHHTHVHADGFSGRHSHPHDHERVEHRHAHVPDMHHRHSH